MIVAVDTTAGIGRRTLLGALALAPVALAACSSPTAPPSAPGATPSAGPPADAAARLAAIETRFGGRLGVHAVDTGTGATVGHRADERFLLCSTGKVPTVAAVLRRTADQPAQLERRIRWTPEQIAGGNSPVGKAKQATGATIAELCDAAITVSDNTAMNLLLDELGGPAAVTAFLRAIGDPLTRLDRPEPALNVVAPGDLDTTTPAQIATDLRALALGDALPAAPRDRLVALMVANTTGGAQIRAGVPGGWRVADKTGSGAQGESNDIGVVWPPGRAPLVIAAYTSPTDPRNTGGKAAIAEATRVVVSALVG